MLKKFSVVLVAGALAFSLAACSKQEPQKTEGAPAGGAPQMGGGAPQQGQPTIVVPQKGQEPTVELPAEVKGKWKAIKVTVEDKTKNTKKEYTIAIGQSEDIPGTKLSIKAVEFVPSFVMQGLNITSASNEPNNPAARVIISENGKEAFKGWLFEKYPTTHAFTHPAYAVTLTGWEKS